MLPSTERRVFQLVSKATIIFLLTFGSLTMGEESLSVDTNFVTVIHDNFSRPNSYFGYTISLAQDASKSGWLFIGAPKTNVTSVKRGKDNIGSYFEPGAVWRCKIGAGIQKCEMLHFLNQLCEGKVKALSKGRLGPTGTCDSSLMGGSLAFENGIFTACAPTWRRNMGTNATRNLGLRVDGACYWMNEGTALKENLVEDLAGGTAPSQSAHDRGGMIPFLETTRLQLKNYKLDPDLSFRWYHAQSGFSVHVTPEKQVLLGAPGTRRKMGGVVKVEGTVYKNWSMTNSDKFPEKGKDNNYHEERNTYLGYAVTSGRYINEARTLYAASAPRAREIEGQEGENLLGVVVIMGPGSFLPSNPPEYFKESKADWKYWRILKGKSFASYFGASLESVDLNKDGKEELLVGAPFEELISSSSGKIIARHGCVYVYSARGGGDFIEPKKEICGDVPFARFGMSIAKLGDLNQDGYNDFAVGAPYEEGVGAVYIFYGDKDLNMQKFQIRGKNYKPAFLFSAFGYSIAGGVDLDGNDTPDFSVGSYTDKHVTVFRTRPKLEITSEMFAYINDRREGGSLKLEKNATSFTLQLCIAIQVKSSTEVLSRERDTVIRSSVKIDAEEMRFRIGGKFSFTTLTTIPSGKNEKCVEFEARRPLPGKDQLELQKDVLVKWTLAHDQISTPVPVSALTIHQNRAGQPELTAPGVDFTEFCSTCPYPMTTETQALSIPFKKDCKTKTDPGTLPICVPKLQVTLSGRYGECHKLDESINGSNIELTLGNTSCLQILVKVRNTGQPAFDPRIRLHWSWDPKELALPTLTSAEECNITSENGEATCKLDRVKTYLGRNLRQKLSFEFNMEHINDSVSSKPKNFTVGAEVFLESDHQFRVNSALQIKYKVDAKIDLLEGAARNSSLPLAGHLSYLFKANISGVSPVKVDLKFLLPDSIIWEGQKIQIFNIRLPKGLVCQNGSRTDPALKSYGQNLTSGKGTFGGLYNSHYVRIVNCAFFATAKNRFLDVSFGLTLKNSNLAKKVLQSVGAMDFYGTAYAKILDLEPKFTTTRITINPPENTGLASWIILAAAAGGFVFLFLLVVLLCKCGFFKRDKKEQLEMMKGGADSERVSLLPLEEKTLTEAGYASTD